MTHGAMAVDNGRDVGRERRARLRALRFARLRASRYGAVELIVLVLYADAKLKVPAHRVFGTLRIAVAAGLVAAAAVLGVHEALLSAGQGLRFLVEVVVGVAVYLGTVLALDRSAVRDIWTLARTAVAR